MKKIILTRGLVALVDDIDFKRLNKFKWYAQKNGTTFYAARNTPRVNGKQSAILMHCEIKTAGPGREIDHRDGNGLNNRRKNLRVVTHHQNTMNQKARLNRSSGLRGVTSNGNKWQARIGYAGGRICLGSFVTVAEAYNAYETASKRFFGRFRRINTKQQTTNI